MPKGRPQLPLMEQEELVERLNGIAERFYELPTLTILESNSPPFDISKPVMHDNKPAFLREKKAVETLWEVVKTLDASIGAQVSEDDPSLREMSVRLWAAIDAGARRQKSRAIPTAISELLLGASVDQSLSLSLFRLIMELEEQLFARKQELEHQEAEYWSDSHRPPNHYARIIALRFAMAIHARTGEVPTFGIARDGNHPSTDYGRALEEIFELLGIKASVKNAASWALKEARTQAQTRPRNALATGLLGAAEANLAAKRGPFNALAILKKDRGD